MSLGSAIVYYVSELYLVKSSALRDVERTSTRILLCIEAALETPLTGGCSLELSSIFSRSLRVVVSYLFLFVGSLFGGVITSQLTTSALDSMPPTVADLRGLRIGISGTLLQPFLTSTRVLAVPVIYGDLEEAAKEFYNGNKDNIDGYITSTDIVRFFRSKHGSNDFVATDEFTQSGVPELKAWLLSKNMERAAQLKVNAALMDLRDTGVLAELFAKYIPAAGAEELGDIPIPAEHMAGIFGGVIAGTALFAALVFGAKMFELVQDRRKGSRGKKGSEETEITQTPLTVLQGDVLFGESMSLDDQALVLRIAKVIKQERSGPRAASLLQEP